MCACVCIRACACHTHAHECDRLSARVLAYVSGSAVAHTCTTVRVRACVKSRGPEGKQAAAAPLTGFSPLKLKPGRRREESRTDWGETGPEVRGLQGGEGGWGRQAFSKGVGLRDVRFFFFFSFSSQRGGGLSLRPQVVGSIFLIRFLNGVESISSRHACLIALRDQLAHPQTQGGERGGKR